MTDMRELIDQFEAAALAATQRAAGSKVSEATLLAFFEMNPFPSWIKAVRNDGSIHMIRTNAAYETEVGISPQEYELMSDYDVQDEVTAREFNKNDLAAIERGEVLYVKEHDRDRVTGQPREWCVWKWPVEYDGTVIAVCGIAMGPGDGRE